ncbi:hypothetical protein LRH25_32545, partial [Ideonella azotifigens]|nr:hypothetical protein [Ideonella azotifigens]
MRQLSVRAVDLSRQTLGRSVVWWSLCAPDRRLLLAAAVGLSLASVAGLGLWQWQVARTEDLVSQLAVAQAEQLRDAQRAAADAGKAGSSPAPWWTHLSRTTPAGEPLHAHELLTSHAVSAAAEREVQLSKLSFRAQAVVAGSPYRSSLMQAEVRGRYPQLKGWLR